MPTRPLKHHFFFRFVDHVTTSGEFIQSPTPVGIIRLKNMDDTIRQSRWVDVTAVGPTCTRIRVGDRVLLPALRWTESMHVDQHKTWKSDHDQCVAIMKSGVPTPMSGIVLFEVPEPVTATSGGIILLAPVNDDGLQRGTAVAIGPDEADIAVGDRIVFSDDNFFDWLPNQIKQCGFVHTDKILLVEG